MEEQSKQDNKQDRYLKERLNRQLTYYSKRASFNKTCHLSLQVIIGLGAIAVPFLIGFDWVLKWIPPTLSILVAAATALENIFKFGNNWHNFRQTEEALKQQQFLFETEAGRYRRSKEPNPFTLFVETCEGLMADESQRFFNTEDKHEQTLQISEESQQSDTTDNNTSQSK